MYGFRGLLASIRPTAATYALTEVATPANEAHRSPSISQSIGQLFKAVLAAVVSAQHGKTTATALYLMSLLAALKAFSSAGLLLLVGIEVGYFMFRAVLFGLKGMQFQY